MRVAVVLRALTDEALSALKEAYPDWREVWHGERMLEVHTESAGREAALQLLRQHDEATGGDVVVVGAYEELA